MGVQKNIQKLMLKLFTKPFDSTCDDDRRIQNNGHILNRGTFRICSILGRLISDQLFNQLSINDNGSLRLQPDIECCIPKITLYNSLLKIRLAFREILTVAIA